MTTIVVWYLVFFTHGGSWSPPMPTAQECERVRAVLKESGSYYHRCIQITEVLKK